MRMRISSSVDDLRLMLDVKINFVVQAEVDVVGER
jgi:hypothetical protein